LRLCYNAVTVPKKLLVPFRWRRAIGWAPPHRERVRAAPEAARQHIRKRGVAFVAPARRELQRSVSLNPVAADITLEAMDSTGINHQQVPHYAHLRLTFRTFHVASPSLALHSGIPARPSTPPTCGNPSIAPSFENLDIVPYQKVNDKSYLGTLCVKTLKWPHRKDRQPEASETETMRSE
jgi:hypothetical protein